MSATVIDFPTGVVDVKKVVTLVSALHDCGRFQESLKILDKAVEDIEALGYQCEVQDFINDKPVARFRSALPVKSNSLIEQLQERHRKIAEDKAAGTYVEPNEDPNPFRHDDGKRGDPAIARQRFEEDGYWKMSIDEKRKYLDVVWESYSDGSEEELDKSARWICTPTQYPPESGTELASEEIVQDVREHISEQELGESRLPTVELIKHRAQLMAEGRAPTPCLNPYGDPRVKCDCGNCGAVPRPSAEK